jgi:hypothetical protein
MIGVGCFARLLDMPKILVLDIPNGDRMPITSFRLFPFLKGLLLNIQNLDRNGNPD